ncbi:MAG: hypothetical protein AMXMBFR74_20970 [Parvibaculum sp.]
MGTAWLTCDMRRTIPALAATLIATGVLFAGCGSASDIGAPPEEPGPMGSTATPSQASLPSKNSQSLPIERPE